MKRAIVGMLLAGWLADVLAREDPDIEAGIAAYEAEDWDAALESWAKAEERLGGRPEIDFDRGLALLAKGDPEGAKTAFESASESRDENIRASAHYELGNIAFDAQEWDVAIQHYIDCLKARPDHGNAKWNLELALRKKKEQEDEEKEKEDEQEKNEDEQNEDEQNEDEQNEDEQNEDEQNDEKQDEQKQDDEKQDEQKQDEQKQDEQKQDDEKQDEQKQDEQKQDEQKQDEQKAQPAPIDRMDIERALQQLDQEDPFDLDRPKGGYVQPEKDW